MEKLAFKQGKTKKHLLMFRYTASWNYFQVRLHLMSTQEETQSIYFLSQFTEQVSKDKCQTERIK